MLENILSKDVELPLNTSSFAKKPLGGREPREEKNPPPFDTVPSGERTQEVKWFLQRALE